MTPTLHIHGWNDAVFALGDAGIAGHRKTAFLCSRHYPARAVLRIYDWAKAMRDSGECVISGFHSDLERDVFAILLNGSQPIILATARGLPKRYPADLKKAIDGGRLLVVSPFADSVRRITANTSRRRNEFMLAVADRIVIGYATPNGVLEKSLPAVAPETEISRLADSET